MNLITFDKLCLLLIDFAQFDVALILLSKFNWFVTV